MASSLFTSKQGKAGAKDSCPLDFASGWRRVTMERISAARDMGRSRIINTFPCSIACSNIFRREFGTCGGHWTRLAIDYPSA